jgi:hypothetical protein
MRRSRWLVWGVGLVVASACDRAIAPSVEACSTVLARRIPAARVVEAGGDATHATLDFEVGVGWWTDPERGQLACTFEQQPNGGLRLSEATLDGVAFTASERTVINVELLLADMRRSVEEPDARRD